MERSRILAAWWDARRAARLDADGLAQRRARLWQRLTPALAATPAFAALAGAPLAAFPTVDAQAMRQDFDRRNSLGLTREAAMAAALAAEAGGDGLVASGIVAGLSTGSSGGPRGLFLASSAERARYIGHSLARLLPPGALLGGTHILLVLRADSGLYRTVRRAGRFRFTYLPLGAPPEAIAAAGADIVIAPAHVLAALARARPAGWQVPRRLYWGAEPMGDAEAAWIAERLGTVPLPIYQATEGFLAAPCRHGRLHLAEDALAIELEPIPGTALHRPIVTDLFRRSQPMLRTRLDDALELDASPCPCGFGARCIRPPAGRAGDIWRFDGAVLTPRAVTDALETLLGPATDWQAIASPYEVLLRLAQPQDGATAGLKRWLQQRGVDVPVRIDIVPSLADGPKRRRVRWRP